MKHPDETLYMYASARLHALERHMIGRERLEALLAARTPTDIMARLRDYGVLAPAATGSADHPADTTGKATSDTLPTPTEREAALTALLRTAYRETEEALPDPALVRYLRYPYDATNLKIAMKCLVRGISPVGMLGDLGTVPPEEIPTLIAGDSVATGRAAEALPSAMAAAIPAARAAYNETGDPRLLDAILDKACFADMLDAATAAGEPTPLDWLRARIDLINCLSTVRLLRMKRGPAGTAFLAASLIPGGTLPLSLFEEGMVAGEETFLASLRGTRYAPLCDVEGEPPALRDLERTADDYLMTLIKPAARLPFGAPVAVGFLYGWETAVKNLRILLAAHAAGWDTAAIRERSRLSYV